VLGKNSSWDKVVARRESRKAQLASKREAVEGAKERRRAAGRHRAQANQRKKANQARSAVLQPISNPATLKKMMKSKKQRKLLRKMDSTKVEAP
jgi:rRNA-processing protein CGR1